MDNLLAAKLAILGKFKTATAALRDALEDGDQDSINALLAERQQCLGLVGRIDAVRGPCALPRKDEAGLGREIRALLEKTISLDRECAERLQIRVEELRAASAAANHSPLSRPRRVLPHQKARPRFLDTRT